MAKSKLISGTISSVSFVSGLVTCYQLVQQISSAFSWKSVFSSYWFYLTLILLLVSIGFFLLFRKTEKQKLIIESLIEENRRQYNKTQIAKLHGHSLTFTHLKYQLSRLYNNHITLSLLSIKNTVENNPSPRKDSIVTMELIGVCTEHSLCFKFAITGQSVVTAADINLEAYDLIGGNKLTVSAVDFGSKNDVREFTITYKQPKSAGNPIHLKITWRWPEMLELEDDFITLPNFYSETTSNIKMELSLNPLQKCQVANVYKYAPELAEPIHLCDVSRTPSNTFVFELANPDKDSDYILYYK